MLLYYHEQISINTIVTHVFFFHFFLIQLVSPPSPGYKPTQNRLGSCVSQGLITESLEYSTTWFSKMMSLMVGAQRISMGPSFPMLNFSQGHPLVMNLTENCIFCSVNRIYTNTENARSDTQRNETAKL